MRALPEICVGLLAGYFFLRELGTFPAAWADDSMFMIVARNVAEGRGYGLEILGRSWEYPHFLGVGPLLIYPPALLIKIFGFSVTIARIPMVIYLALSTVVCYLCSRDIAGRINAILVTLLLITFSAFVNTGKPVLGEIPAFFFLMSGLLLWNRGRSPWIVGLSLGCAVMTKTNYGLIIPALGIVFVYSLLKGSTPPSSLSTEALAKVEEGPGEGGAIEILKVLTTTTLIGLSWKLLEMLHAKGAVEELLHIVLEQGGNHSLLSTLLSSPMEYVRLPYAALAFFLIFGGLGLYRSALDRSIKVFIGSLVLLFLLYFLNAPPWYRKILPAHLLILPFVPLGMFYVFHKKLGLLLLGLVICSQAYWQFDYKGSSRSTEAAEAADLIERQYADTPLLIQQLEIYTRLSPNPNWLLYLPEKLTARLPSERVGLLDEQKCLPLIKKGLDGEILSNTRYAIADPSPLCSK